jgi:hypothetical protein
MRTPNGALKVMGAQLWGDVEKLLGGGTDLPIASVEKIANKMERAFVAAVKAVENLPPVK